VSEERPEPVDGLDVHEVEDGFVVYHGDTDRVHYLNATAAVVLSLSDGTRTIDELADLVQAAWELDAPPLAEVQACVLQLRAEGVLR
jgi:hypothetical protein